jgi:hypothetical protein
VYLDGRVEEFLCAYRDKVLGAMSEAELAVNISAVVDNLLEEPKNLDRVSE